MSIPLKSKIAIDRVLEGIGKGRRKIWIDGKKGLEIESGRFIGDNIPGGVEFVIIGWIVRMGRGARGGILEASRNYFIKRS